MTNQQPTESRLGFIDISVFDDGSIRGGILVTDLETRPYEFRVTTPVKPTAMQRVLYGKTLAEYVYGELIGYPLVMAVKEALSLVVAKNEHLLIMRPKLSVPVVSIRKLADEADGGDLGSKMRTFSFRSHPSYAGESEWARTLLGNLMERHSPYEPFERLKVAMDEVHKQKLEP